MNSLGEPYPCTTGVGASQIPIVFDRKEVVSKRQYRIARWGDSPAVDGREYFILLRCRDFAGQPDLQLMEENLTLEEAQDWVVTREVLDKLEGDPEPGQGAPEFYPTQYGPPFGALHP
jgi:hypothetical protein